jgi:hypothetical protein
VRHWPGVLLAKAMPRRGGDGVAGDGLNP